VVSYHPDRRSCSALAYGSRSTATAKTTSTGSYTTSGDATARCRCRTITARRRQAVISSPFMAVSTLARRRSRGLRVLAATSPANRRQPKRYRVRPRKCRRLASRSIEDRPSDARRCGARVVGVPADTGDDASVRDCVAEVVRQIEQRGHSLVRRRVPEANSRTVCRSNTPQGGNDRSARNHDLPLLRR
jgi:hypothetical protein